MTRRTVVAISSVLLLGAAAQAQLFVTPFTESAVGVYATDGKTPALTFKPAKKLFANTSRKFSATAPGVHAGVQVHRVLSLRGFRIREFCYVDAGANNNSAGGTTASTSKTSIKQGVHSYILNVRGVTTSTLAVTMAGTTTGNGKATVTIDIGADNKIEFTQAANNAKAVRKTFTINGGSPNPVRITVNGSASAATGGSSYDMSVIAWVQNPVRSNCFLSRYGKPCTAVDLMGFDSGTQAARHSFNINITGAPKNAAVIIGVGVKSANFKLPRIPCPLLTTPILFLYPPKTDANGNSTLAATANVKLNLTAYLQCAVADSSGVARMSNGLRIDCFDQ